MADAFIKICRKMLQWEWYDDINTKVVFLHCLLRANWKPGTWHGIEYNAGEFITSLPTLAKETHLTIQQVRTALDHLKLTGEITDKRQGNTRIITVVKWSEHQGDNRLPTDHQQTFNRLSTADKEYKEYKEYKEGKEVKNKVPVYFPNDETLDDTFKEFLKMRKQIKKPMGDHAIELAIKKLNDLSGGDNDKAIKIINQSIMGSWQSFYELKEDKINQSQNLATKWGVTK